MLSRFLLFKNEYSRFVQSLRLRCLLVVILSSLSILCFSSDKPATIITLQWWESGRLIIKFTIDEKTASKLQNPGSALGLLIIDGAKGEYVIKHETPILNGGREHIFSFTVEGKGHLHIVSGEPLNISPVVSDSPLAGGLSYSILRDDSLVESSMVELTKNTSGVLQELTYQEWKNHPRSGVDVEMVLGMHKVLVDGAYTDLKVVPYDFETGTLFIEKNVVGIREAFKDVEKAMIPKPVPRAKPVKSLQDEIVKGMEVLQIAQMKELSISSSKGADTVDLFAKLVPELQGDPSGDGEPGRKEKSKVNSTRTHSLKVSSPKITLDALSSESDLAARVPSLTLTLMEKNYEQTYEVFQAEIDALLPESAAIELRKREVPLLYFLHAARIAGFDTYHKLPSMGVGRQSQKVVEAFFAAPEYKWESLVGVKVEDESEDDQEEMEVIQDDNKQKQVIDELLSAVERTRQTTSSEPELFSSAAYESELNSLLQIVLPDRVCTLENELNVGNAYLAYRMTIMDMNTDIPAEIRIYKNSGGDAAGFDAAIKTADTYAKATGRRIFPQVLASLSSDGVHVQVVLPSYPYVKNQMRTIKEVLESRKVESLKALSFLQHTLEALSQLHRKKVLMDYIGPEQIIRHYDGISALSSISFVEVKLGLKAVKTDDYKESIKQGLFQILKLFFHIRTGEPLGGILGTLNALGHAYENEDDFQSKFFEDLNQGRHVWQSWIGASSAPNLEVSNEELMVIDAFCRGTFDWTTSTRIYAVVKKANERLSSGRRPVSSSVVTPSGVVPAGQLYSQLRTPLDEFNLPKVEVSALELSDDPVVPVDRKHSFRPKCRSGHPLSMRDVSDGKGQYGTGVACDQCKAGGIQNVLKEGKIMSCRKCEYDLCGACSVRNMKVIALPPETEVKCEKGHSMSFISSSQKTKGPSSDRRQCDGCELNLGGLQYYECETCYKEKPASKEELYGFDYCPKCAFKKAIQKARVTSAKSSKLMKLSEVAAGKQVNCQECNSLYSEGSAIFSEGNDNACISCAVDRLHWFGSQSTHNPLMSKVQ